MSQKIMSARQHAWVLLSVGAFFAIFCTATPSAGADEPNDFFEKHVRPILAKRCLRCHSGAKTGGGLSLEHRTGWQKGGENGPVIVPGQPDQSLLIDAINYRSVEMPPADQGGRLSDADIAVLTRWVAMGAPDPRERGSKIGGMSQEEARTWWAFQPLPDGVQPGTAADIDLFVDRAIEERGLSQSSMADKRTLIRRATYDLTGLPPTLADVVAFEADQSPDAFRRVIDRLLASPQYGVKWGRHWLDVVRYADTAGENTDRPLPHAWRYRNWVIDAFNRDLPYDDFVKVQLSGDLLTTELSGEERQAGIVATGYLAIARRFGHDIDKDIHLMHEDVIDNLGKNFLGLTLGCARCHDHKYDAVSAEDYYALYGIFQSSRFSFPGCEPKGQPRDLVPLIPQGEADRLMAEYNQKVAVYKEAVNRPTEAAQRFKQLASESTKVIASSSVGEGQSVPFGGDAEIGGEVLTLRAGEVLELNVLPNGSHGADTTLVEWEVFANNGEGGKAWSVASLIPRLGDDGPAFEDQGATWSLTDNTNGPVFLRERKRGIEGKSELNGWSLGDTPSVFSNRGSQPVSVWTTLPPQSFFVHPGPARPVAVSWVCPSGGQYRMRGRVADAHPAGGDGVSFQLKHLTSSELGQELRGLAQMTIEKLVAPEPPAVPVAYAVVDSTPTNVRLHQRGDPELPGDEVPRRWLTVFGKAEVGAGQGSGRRQLGEWIAAQPLASRVMVNRIWQWHFGRGIVGSPNDFGSRGDTPSHPELLDWLAVQFRLSGYSVKSMHRLMMLSQAYQRGSDASEAELTGDPDLRFRGSFSRRRLTAEELRDSLLMTSGNLDPSAGEAHPFPPEASWGFSQHNPFTAVYESNRRSAFLMVQRQRRHPFLALFDGADPNSSTGLRQVTTVPTQALYFLNDPFFHAQAAGVAQRLKSESVADGIDALFERVYQRKPTVSERGAGADFVDRYPGNIDEKWIAYARVLLASNEFLFLD
jgi:hypothetical protein